MTAAKATQASNKKRLTGVVKSNKMKDTIVVEVMRYEKHPKYEKFLKLKKRYKADDKGNTKNVGETVEIEECRPISKDKRFKVVA
jgi:small subunit ribosomal protein S17